MCVCVCVCVCVEGMGKLFAMSFKIAYRYFLFLNSEFSSVLIAIMVLQCVVVVGEIIVGIGVSGLIRFGLIVI